MEAKYLIIEFVILGILLRSMFYHHDENFNGFMSHLRLSVFRSKNS